MIEHLLTSHNRIISALDLSTPQPSRNRIDNYEVSVSSRRNQFRESMFIQTVLEAKLSFALPAEMAIRRMVGVKTKESWLCSRAARSNGTTATGVGRRKYYSGLASTGAGGDPCERHLLAIAPRRRGRRSAWTMFGNSGGRMCRRRSRDRSRQMRAEYF